LETAKRELMEETGYGGGEWTKTATLSPNASAMSNLTHCYIARGVELTGGRSLDEGEDLEVCLFSRDEVRGMLERGEIWQSLMAAPLWKMFAEEK
jgi:8-oxo-dGTP pyrophosphatase MutT (NUDIX family)